MEIDGMFRLERVGEAQVLTTLLDLGELEYGRIEQAGEPILKLLDEAHAQQVVIDLDHSDYCGSTALGFFLRIWKRVSLRGGKMALCNVSQHCLEILAVMQLHSLWAICDSRQEALKAVADDS